MEELLIKYYEYFIKGNFQDRISIDENSEFYFFYKLIINEYNLSENKHIKDDIKEFFNFYDELNILNQRKPGIYSTTKGENSSKKRFKKNNKTTFKWFKPSPYMFKNSTSIYSIGNTHNLFCKIYISVKPQSYIKTLIKFQDFINQLYINHPNEIIGEFKFKNIPSNCAITICFTNQDHYYEFLEFLNKNQNLLEDFDIPNLFMPTNKYNISVISDNNSSYIYYVTRMIWDYMFYCKQCQVEFSIKNFIDYIKKYNYLKDQILCKINNETINDYKEILIGKILNISNDELLSIIFKEKDKTLKKNLIV